MIDLADYRFLSALLHARSGLWLGPSKDYLLESRLTPLAATLGLPSLQALVQHLRAGADPATVRLVCEAMTTNESFFFRDSVPFQLLRERVLPELIAARRATRRLRIWSCAASTGQEPYSIAMILDDLSAQLSGWSVEVLGTDYSRAALDRARSGIYNHFEVQRGLPIQQLTRHFRPVGSEWQISERLRAAVRFQESNLLEPFSHLGRFDVVFCRNVLIYFDLPTKTDVLGRLTRVLAPDGYLFLGGSETVMGVSTSWERVTDAGASLYRLAPAALSVAV